MPNDIDLAGWELKKALCLFRKSNPPMLEWLHSPIVYTEPYDTAGKLRTLMKEYFSQCLPASLPEHSNRNFETYLKKDLVRTKKYFYVLRSLLACDWIMQHNAIAPMEFRTLMVAQIPDGEVKEAIEALLFRKMSGEELREEPATPVLHRFLADKLAYYFDYVQGLNKADPPATGKLDALFQETLAAVW